MRPGRVSLFPVLANYRSLRKLRAITGLKMIKIKYVPNRFEREGAIEKEVSFNRELKLRHYFAAFNDLPPVDFEKFDCIVSGKNVNDLDQFINDGDEII